MCRLSLPATTREGRLELRLSDTGLSDGEKENKSIHISRAIHESSQLARGTTKDGPPSLAPALSVCLSVCTSQTDRVIVSEPLCLKTDRFRASDSSGKLENADTANIPHEHPKISDPCAWLLAKQRR